MYVGSLIYISSISFLKQIVKTNSTKKRNQTFTKSNEIKSNFLKNKIFKIKSNKIKKALKKTKME